MKLPHVIALAVLALAPLLGCAAPTPPKKAASMLTDQQLSDALQEKATIILAKIVSSTLLIPGTRSQRTEYQIEISQVILGQASGPAKATHFGTPQLDTGKTYLIVLVPTGRFGTTPEMEAWIEVPKAQQSEILRTHADRLHRLTSKTP